jgi:hypothetical protein
MTDFTPTDFRALCAELVEKLDALNCSYNIPSQSALVERARAALAQPEPQGPTDEELWDLYQHLGSYFSPTEFARTVLARWGTPTNTINQED